MDIMLLAEQLVNLDGPHHYSGQWLNHCRQCQREIDQYWVVRRVWPPVRDLCLGCALSYQPETDPLPRKRELVEAVKVGYLIRDSRGKLVQSGDCTESEFELIKQQTACCYRIVACWPPRGPAWRSTGTVERLIEGERR